MQDLKWAAEEISRAIADEIKIAKSEAKNEEEADYISSYGTRIHSDALKIYKIILDTVDDESFNYSGYSMALLLQDVKRLLAGLPVTPLTGDDDEWREWEPGYYQNNRYGLLLKKVRNGEVLYSDMSRVKCYSVSNPERGGSSIGFVSSIISEQYPISFPYLPPETPFKAYIDTGENLNLIGIYNVRTPAGYLEDVKRFFYKEDKDVEYTEISFEEFVERMAEYERKRREDSEV